MPELKIPFIHTMIDGKDGHYYLTRNNAQLNCWKQAPYADQSAMGQVTVKKIQCGTHCPKFSIDINQNNKPVAKQACGQIGSMQELSFDQQPEPKQENKILTLG